MFCHDRSCFSTGKKLRNYCPLKACYHTNTGSDAGAEICILKGEKFHLIGILIKD